MSGPIHFDQEEFSPKPGFQLERAALLAYSYGQLWGMIHRGQLKPESLRGIGYLCMNQYTRLNNSCKTPGTKADKLNFYFKTESEGSCPSHLVVICRGRFFKLDMLRPSGDFLTVPELQSQLRKIKESCDKSDAAPGLGALTGDERTRWAENREYLIKLHQDHAEHLREIETSIAVLALDDYSPKDADDLGLSGLAGNSRLRWCDKTASMVVFKDGNAIGNADHAGLDGMAMMFLEYFVHRCIEENAEVTCNSMECGPLEDPRELVFHYDEKLCAAIETAVDVFNKIGNNLECIMPQYKGYGKSIIKSFQVPPTAFAQMAIQLAYYKMYDRPASTHEAASLRKFWHGRTETVRSCTTEAISWAKAMLDEQAKPSIKLSLFKAAVKKHMVNTIDSMEAKACDRHLLALSALAEEEGLPTPAIFTDPAYTMSGGGGQFVLLTSMLGFTRSLGIAAPRPKNGYAVFYNIQPDRFGFGLTAWKEDRTTSVHELYSSIVWSLEEMRKVMESQVPSANKIQNAS